LVPVASEYGEAVSLTLDVPVGAAARVIEELRDRTSGVAQVHEVG
jgi:hypothetical protein